MMERLWQDFVTWRGVYTIPPLRQYGVNNSRGGLWTLESQLFQAYWQR